MGDFIINVEKLSFGTNILEWEGVLKLRSQCVYLHLDGLRN